MKSKISYFFLFNVFFQSVFLFSMNVSQYFEDKDFLRIMAKKLGKINFFLEKNNIRGRLRDYHLLDKQVAIQRIADIKHAFGIMVAKTDWRSLTEGSSRHEDAMSKRLRLASMKYLLEEMGVFHIIFPKKFNEKIIISVDPSVSDTDLIGEKYCKLLNLNKDRAISAKKFAKNMAQNLSKIIDFVHDNSSDEAKENVRRKLQNDLLATPVVASIREREEKAISKLIKKYSQPIEVRKVCNKKIKFFRRLRTLSGRMGTSKIPNFCNAQESLQEWQSEG